MTVERSLHGVRFYADEHEPALWRYWPESLSAETSPDGGPTLSLLVMGEGATLQLGARWAPDEETLDRLRAHLASEAGVASVRLAPAPAHLGDALLEVGDGSGEFREIARASTSGFPPYQVVFSVALSADDKTRAANAIAGRGGWLRVRCSASLSRPCGAQGRATGWLPAAGKSDGRAAVTGAMEAGDLLVEVTGADRRLRDQVRKLLLAQAVSAARSATGRTQVDIRAAMGAVARDSVELVGDVGDWIPAASAHRHVTNLGTST